MARNLREGSLGQVNVRNDSGAAVYGGWVYTLGGHTGVAVTDAADGEVVALDRRPYVHYLFHKTENFTPPAPDAVDELKPAIPGYDFATDAGNISAVAGGGALSVALVEDGDVDSSVYNTPAGHVLVTVLP
jgi:hypothetical protein